MAKDLLQAVGVQMNFNETLKTKNKLLDTHIVDLDKLLSP